MRVLDRARGIGPLVTALPKDKAQAQLLQ